MSQQNFPGHGVFRGTIKELPTSEYPYYYVEYEGEV